MGEQTVYPGNKEETMYTPRQIWRQVTPKVQLLIVLSLATVLAFSAGLAAGIYGHTMYTFLMVNRDVTAPAAPMTASNQAAPLGIALPAGAQRSDLPTGLTDYLRPGNTTSTIGMQSHPLGIDLPRGADVHDLPRGLTDYLRPQRPAAAPQTAPNVPAIGTGSVYDGGHYGAAPATVNPNRPAIGTGSAYDGGHYGSPVMAPQTSPNVPISGTGSAYNGK
jgi:hypothetical protein